MSVRARRGKRRKLKNEINVVPYIDVMLVLLIIFMVTAPLMNLGVDVQLPESNAKSITEQKDPVVVSVDRDGNYFLAIEAGSNEAVDGFWPLIVRGTGQDCAGPFQEYHRLIFDPTLRAYAVPDSLQREGCGTP